MKEAGADEEVEFTEQQIAFALQQAEAGRRGVPQEHL
jgi:hypothetical protein